MNTDLLDANKTDGAYSEPQISAMMREIAETARRELGGRLVDVILYGSYARGDSRAWSDIDVLIAVNADDGEIAQIKNLLMDKLWDLVYETNLLLSILVVNAARYEEYKTVLPFYSNVNKEGRRFVA